MTTNEMNLTYHARVQRANRVQHIIDEIGIGQIVREKYVQAGMGAGNYICITDTGVTLVKTADKLKVVTIYVTTQRELVMVYGGTKKIPPFLKKKVDRNQSKFTKEGKTIWR